MSIFGPAIRSRYHSLWRRILAPRMLRRRNLIVSVAFTVYRRGFRLSPISEYKFRLHSLNHYPPAANSTTGAADEPYSSYESKGSTEGSYGSSMSG